MLYVLVCFGVWWNVGECVGVLWNVANSGGMRLNMANHNEMCWNDMQSVRVSEFYGICRSDVECGG